MYLKTKQNKKKKHRGYHEHTKCLHRLRCSPAASRGSADLLRQQMTFLRFSRSEWFSVTINFKKMYLSQFKMYFNMCNVIITSDFVIIASTCLRSRHDRSGITFLMHLKCHLISQWYAERSEGEKTSSIFVIERRSTVLDEWMQALFTGK